MRLVNNLCDDLEMFIQLNIQCTLDVLAQLSIRDTVFFLPLCVFAWCFGWLTPAVLAHSISQQVHTGANAALALSDLRGYCCCRASLCECV